MKKRIIAAGAATAVLSLALAGCSAQVNTQDVKTDYGVTADTITLGSLTDVSKIYTALAPSVSAGNQIYFDERNAAGGICGRQVVIDSQDHGSDNTKVTTLFQSIEPNILGLTQLLGSPQQAAIKELVANAEVTAMLAGWSSTALVTADAPNNKYYVLAGTTYPLDVINALSWMQDEKKISKGNTIGYINVPGDFGADARSGGEYFAEENGYEFKGIEITGQEPDLAAQVDQLKSANASVVVVSAGPGVVGKTVAAMKAAGMNVPVIINNPGYTTKFVAADSPTADFFQKNVYIASSLLPFGDETEQTAAVKKAFEDGKAAGTIGETVSGDPLVNYGYAMASIYGQALDKACSNGDLTRAGVNDALSTLSKVVTGVTVDLDYTDRSKSPSTETYISVPSGTASGTTSLVAKTGTSATAEKFSNK